MEEQISNLLDQAAIDEGWLTENTNKRRGMEDHFTETRAHRIRVEDQSGDDREREFLIRTQLEIQLDEALLKIRQLERGR